MVEGPDGRAQVVTRPVVVPSGTALPTTVTQLRLAAGLPTEDVAVNAAGSVTAAAEGIRPAPAAWRDPADSVGRTVGVLGLLVVAVGGVVAWLVRRRRTDEVPATHA